MEIRDIDAEDEELEQEGHKFVGDSWCRGSLCVEGDLNDHYFCDECGDCGHPGCDEYRKEHHGKGLPEEKTPPAPGSLGSSLKLEQVRFRIIGQGGFRTEHVGKLVRIYGDKTFHVALTSDGTIEIYYCGKIESIDKD